jgi:gluconate kinase
VFHQNEVSFKRPNGGPLADDDYEAFLKNIRDRQLEFAKAQLWCNDDDLENIKKIEPNTNGQPIDESDFNILFLKDMSERYF